MAMGAACLKKTSTRTDQRSLMACLTLPTHYLQTFLSTQGTPLALVAIEAKDVEVDLSGAVEDFEGVFSLRSRAFLFSFFLNFFYICLL